MPEQDRIQIDRRELHRIAALAMTAEMDSALGDAIPDEVWAALYEAKLIRDCFYGPTGDDVVTVLTPKGERELRAALDRRQAARVRDLIDDGEIAEGVPLELPGVALMRESIERHRNLELRRELGRLRAENDRPRQHIEQALDFVAEAYDPEKEEEMDRG